MRIIFMGTPAFALPALEAVHARHEIIAVYTQPPRPAGRGQKERPSPVQLYAEAHGLPVFTPLSLKNETLPLADVAVVAAYGLLLPEHILNAPRLGCINVHPSLLPRWRGAAPLQRTLMAGDTQTGVCIMHMEAGLDTGPVYACEHYNIPPEMDAGGLHDTLAARGASLLAEVLDKLETLTPVPQAEQGVTYAKKITKQEARLDWSRPAAELLHHIRGLSPSPAAWCEMQGEAVKIFRAALSDAHGTPGTVLDDKLTIACGDSALTLLDIQRPGKKRMPASEALKSWNLAPGSTLT